MDHPLRLQLREGRAGDDYDARVLVVVAGLRGVVHRPQGEGIVARGVRAHVAAHEGHELVDHLGGHGVHVEGLSAEVTAQRRRSVQVAPARRLRLAGGEAVAPRQEVQPEVRRPEVAPEPADDVVHVPGVEGERGQLGEAPTAVGDELVGPAGEGARAQLARPREVGRVGGQGGGQVPALALEVDAELDDYGAVGLAVGRVACGVYGGGFHGGGICRANAEQIYGRIYEFLRFFNTGRLPAEGGKRPAHASGAAGCFVFLQK